MSDDNAKQGSSNGRGAHWERLSVFVGRWRAEGESYAAGQIAQDPRASRVAWASDESYEWLPGGFFLLHQWDAMVGSYPFKGTEILGYEERKGGYFTQLFDNAGHHAEYRVTVEGNTWFFTEEATRAAATISDDRDRIMLKWEWRNAGADWLPLCEREARRIPARAR